MITIQHLNKYFNKGKKNQVHVINNTSLKLPDNGLVALLGPSGCGKTTLLNALGGLDKAKSGKIFINGRRLNSRFSHRVDKMRNLKIGYIFQDYKLVDYLSVYDNVALALKMTGLKDKKEIKIRVDYVLEKLGILRYKNRPAGMLSGGERQRVGIARALVKDPDIILADEPTGNLDSKNTIEIMNIIKTISKDRLVLLVTHEQPLANFYATRIIELQDGSVVRDYENKHEEHLDYAIDNRFYLKDFENTENFKNEHHDVRVFHDGSNRLNLDIVIKNGNIYIKSNDKQKIEVVDENSSIDFVDEHYKHIRQQDIEDYDFNLKNVSNKKFKMHYSSILNPFTLLLNGFRKVFGFSVLKKILLAGFVLSGIFIMYASSSILATITVKDEDFVDTNSNYSIITSASYRVEDYLNYESFDGVKYLLPGNSIVNFNMENKEYYQTSQYSLMINGSLSSLEMISHENLISGRMPENEYELIMDRMTLTNLMDRDSLVKNIGISNYSQFIGKKFTIPEMNPFTLVGIVDLKSPSIYTTENLMLNILYNSSENIGMDGMYYPEEDSMAMESFGDYNFHTENFVLKTGRLPENDYEVIVDISNKDSMPLNREISTTINDTKLKVVGYYESQNNIQKMLVTTNTLKYALINKSSDITVYTENKNTGIQMFKDAGLYITDSYENSRSNYMKSIREAMIAALISSGIIIAISLIEIFLMIRSSFLSRIKEVGIYRAIGVKKADIYKMFAGEIIAITTISSVPGILIATYIIHTLSQFKYISSYIMITPLLVGAVIIFIYLFNLAIGLIPVFNTIRKTPASIMARTDLE